MEIKGIKDGILINLEDQDWLDVKDDMIQKIEDKNEFFLGARIILDVGNNILRAKELGELRDILAEKGVILAGISSLSLVTQETARLLGLKTDLKPQKVKPKDDMQPLDTLLEGEPTVMIRRTMRSGFKVAYHGHVVVLGDVNPGAEIIASGCVVVWGRLRGTVHAGAEGDEDAVVCALDLSPMQLRIASKVAITPNDEEKPQPEIASIKDDQIIAELWQHQQGDK
ncbi:MAG: septum site-determining protein MinC [Chloroflexota bacterium]|jgi:septum site-determining protein MinC|nr:septum site-determining protein MinC [Chloroflexota bacterium]